MVFVSPCGYNYKTRDESIESNYKVKILFEYNDMKKYLDLSYDKMIERLRKEVERESKK